MSQFEASRQIAFRLPLVSAELRVLASAKGAKMAIPKWLTTSRILLAAIPVSAGLAIWRLPYLDANGRSFSNVMAVLEVTVLAIGLYSLYLVSEQVRQTAKWNKLLSYHQFFGELITTAMVKDMLAVAEKFGFKAAMDKVIPMTDASLASLEKEAIDVKTILAYLDEFEEFCGAVQAGVTDHEYAYTLEATRVIRTWIVFGPFIQSQRASHPFSRCYVELERLGSAWKERREAETRQKYSQDGVRQHVA